MFANKNKNPSMFVKPGTVACACTPTLQRQGQGSPGLTNQEAKPNQGVPSNKRPCFKNKVDSS